MSKEKKGAKIIVPSPIKDGQSVIIPAEELQEVDNLNADRMDNVAENFLPKNSDLARQMKEAAERIRRRVSDLTDNS